ncbi:MAG TPA: response regulator [bacterium]|nr:response regulator [bacterium]
MEGYKKMIIVIAEDDDGHAELIKEGLRDSGICNEIIRFSNGKETWEFFKNQSEKTKKPNTGYLLLLDINMPIMDGFEVLRKIKNDCNLKEIPVMMLTTTDDPRDVEECYKIGCNFYVTKPVAFPKFAETLKRMGLFIQIVKI